MKNKEIARAEPHWGALESRRCAPVRASCVLAGCLVEIMPIQEADALHALGYEERMEWFGRNLDRCVFGSPRVVQASAPVGALGDAPNTTGVYFLLHRGRVVYVGQTVNLPLRLASHAARGRPFDAFACIAGLPQWALTTVEGDYVQSWRPAQNIEHARLHAYPWARDFYRAIAQADRSMVSGP